MVRIQAELLNGLKKAREDIENKADCTFTALMFTEDDAQVRDGAYAPQQTFHEASDRWRLIQLVNAQRHTACRWCNLAR